MSKIIWSNVFCFICPSKSILKSINSRNLMQRQYRPKCWNNFSFRTKILNVFIQGTICHACNLTLMIQMINCHSLLPVPNSLLCWGLCIMIMHYILFFFSHLSLLKKENFCTDFYLATTKYHDISKPMAQNCSEKGSLLEGMRQIPYAHKVI